MTTLRIALLTSLLVTIALILPRPSLAQERGERIARVVADCDRRADEFQRMFRHALEHSGYRASC
jgi:hypothetical protein